MANPELGQKQVCPNCQAKFYDLGRRPAHCPKCATDFDPEEALKLRNRRGRPAGYAADETPVDPTEEPGMGEASDDDDVLAEDDDDDSVPFIEDEDDDAFDDEIVKPGKDED